MSDAPDYSRSFGGTALAARLRRLSERLDRDGTRIYAEAGIPFEQRWYGVLRQMVEHGPATVGEIASVLRISHASVSESVRSLRAHGLVTGARSTTDRRRSVLTLTQAGARLIARLGPMWDAFNAAAGELDEEAGHIVAALDRLDDALARRSMYDRIQDRLTTED